MRLSGVLLVLLLLCVHASMFAQDSLSLKLPLVWDLQQCINYSFTNNIQLNTLRLNRQITQENLLLARAALWPNLYFNASQAYNHSKNTGTSISGNWGPTSNWTLYNGGFRLRDIQARRLYIDIANQDILQQENNITLQITQAYLNVLLDKEIIIYLTNVVETSEHLLEQATLRYKAGSIARKDYLQLEAQLARDRLTLTEEKNALRTDLLTLKHILLMPMETQFDIVQPDTMATEMVITPLETVREYALTHRPEVKIGELGVQVSKVELSKAKSLFLPILSTQGSLGSGYNNNLTFGTSQGNFNNSFYQQLGLTLSIPIFTNRINRTNLNIAKINVKQAYLNLADATITLSQTVEQAYINVLNAQARYNSAQMQLVYNREIYRIANQQLQIGSIDIFDFYQQHNLYVQALQEYIQSKYNAALSLSIYNFYLGIPVKL